MNRNALIAVIIAILVIGGIWYYSAQGPADDAVGTAPETTTEPAATETAPAATETAPAATETAPAATETAPAATETAPAATETAPAATETAPAATETAPATTTETAPAAPSGDIAALLDPATFDADKLIAAVDASTLDDATKATLRTAIEGARNDPAAVPAVIDQVKAAMGM